MNEPSGPAVYEHVTRSGFLGTLGCLTIFPGSLLLLAAYQAARTLPPFAAFGIAALVAVAFGALALWLSGDTIVSADADRLVLRSARRLGPLTLTDRVDLEFRWDDIARATEIRRHRVTKHGGFQCDHELSFGKGRKIRATLVGGTQAPDGYPALVAFVKNRLGERFATQDDFGSLGEAMIARIREETLRNP